MIKKRYMAMKSGALKLNAGELNVSLHENTYGDQYFATEDQFNKQVQSGLIIEIDKLPGEK